MNILSLRPFGTRPVVMLRFLLPAVVVALAMLPGGGVKAATTERMSVDSAEAQAWTDSMNPSISAISVASYQACALKGGGVWCWGHNHHGQLGDGTTTDSGVPVPVRCWGYNAYGQLGDGTTVGASVPVAVQGMGSGVTAISAGEHTCAVQGGGAQCWGRGGSGELGTGWTTNRASPDPVSGLSSGVSAISVGASHTCAIKDGGAWCWGYNVYGQLGNGPNSWWFSPPVPVSGLGTGILAIGTGAIYSCALNGAGVWCWGGDDYGELGNGPAGSQSVPGAVGFPLDSDGDGNPDEADNCPTVANGGQANADGDPRGDACELGGCETIPTAWDNPAGDSGDCDGFPDSVPASGRGDESFIGTDPADRCPDNTADNAWPPDVNNSGLTSLADVILFGQWFNQIGPNPPNLLYNPRFDLNANGGVTLADIVAMGPFFNKRCTQ